MHTWLTAADFLRYTGEGQLAFVELDWMSCQTHASATNWKTRWKRRNGKDSVGEGECEGDFSPSAGVPWCNYGCTVHTVLELSFSHVSERDLSLSDDHPVSEESCQSASGTQWPRDLNRATETSKTRDKHKQNPKGNISGRCYKRYTCRQMMILWTEHHYKSQDNLL